MLLRSKIRSSRGVVGIPPRELAKRYFSAHVDVTEVEAFRISLRRWVDKSVIPNINSWEEKGQLPRSIYKEAAQLGVLAPGFPERYGGLGNEHNDLSVLMVVCEELCRAGSGGFIASLLTHNISLQPIIKLGRQEIANNRLSTGHNGPLFFCDNELSDLDHCDPPAPLPLPAAAGHVLVSRRVR